jgi:methylase of polypeptide subunit release factors
MSKYQGPDAHKWEKIEERLLLATKLEREVRSHLEELSAKDHLIEHLEATLASAKELIATYERAMVATGIATEEYEDVWYGDRFSHYATVVYPTDETMLLVAWDEAIIENMAYDRKRLADDLPPF